MKRVLYKRNKLPPVRAKLSGRGGFTLVEVIVASVAFALICGTLAVVLTTVLRIEKTVAVNTNRRETIRMVSDFIRSAAEKNRIDVSPDCNYLKIDDKSLLGYNENCLYAGGVTDESTRIVDGLAAPPQFMLDNNLLTFTLSFEGEEPYEIRIYCPKNG